mgnify:CR=1 FL=1
MLMRPVPGPSPIHNLWAGTKLVIVLAISILLTIAPTWPVIGLTAGLIVLAAALAHIPPSCIPSVPRGIWIVVVIGSIFTVANGGAPEFTVGPITIGSSIFSVDTGGSPLLNLGQITVGIGGFLDFLRISALGLVLLGLGAVTSWTTHVADIAPAVAKLLRPLRLLRLPVDEWAVTIALAFRMFPMLADEFRLLAAARRLQPPPPVRLSRRAEAVEMCTAAMVVALRRATEMADAITARGGPGRISAVPQRLRWADGLAFAVVIGLFGLTFAV